MGVILGRLEKRRSRSGHRGKAKLSAECDGMTELGSRRQLHIQIVRRGVTPGSEGQSIV
jgi:hypothetical protein